MKKLDHKICNDDTLNSQILEQYKAAKKELKLIHEAKGKEAMLRSKMKFFEQGEKPISQRRGTITLIPKEDINLTDLKNWCPITLTNIDYKIILKVLA